jgi:Periplasmic copper-binding protein (NosD)
MLNTAHLGRAILCAALLSLGIGADAAPPDFAWLPPAPELPPPAGRAIHVSTVEQLFQAAQDVQSGGTILVADGHYMMPRYFELRTDGVTLRSESGNRDKVILDGADSPHGELVGVRACSDVTFADLTIQNIRHNGFKINSNYGVHRVTIHNCVIHNIWQRGVKGVRVPKDRPDIQAPQRCRIQHCLFYNDRPKRFEDDSTDTPETFNGNYIGGIDVMYADGWTIRDNVFCGIRGRTGEARGAIFLWHGAEDCLVERNVIVDCDTGICLGNSHRGADTKIHCHRCIVRNNFVTRCPENGILADYTEDCLIAHNTVHDPDSRLKRLIRIVHDNTGLAVINNLLSGPPMRMETKSEIRAEGNVARDVGESFVDLADGDLHLKRESANAVGRVKATDHVPEDFDKQSRQPMTNVGADQWR